MRPSLNAQIADAGAAALSRALAHSERLASLLLHDNHIGEAGQRALDDAAAARRRMLAALEARRQAVLAFAMSTHPRLGGAGAAERLMVRHADAGWFLRRIAELLTPNPTP